VLAAAKGRVIGNNRRFGLKELVEGGFVDLYILYGRIE
jgi:hypothetical protein